VFGMATLLRQFHQSYAHSFLAYLGQYVRSQIGCGADTQSTAGKHTDRSSNIPLEVRNVIIFMSQLCSVSFLGRNALYQYVPQSLVELGS